MIDPGTASLITGGSSALGNLAGLWWQNKQAEKQHDRNIQNWQREKQWQKQHWHDQNKYNLELWHMQNKYNSPIEQMARLEAAGLNPHLMYGKGTVGTAGQVPSTNVSTASDIKGYSYPQATNVMRGIDFFKNHAELKNINAQTEQTETLTELTTLKQITEMLRPFLMGADLETKKLNNKFLEETLMPRINNIFQDNRKRKIDNYVNEGTADTRIALASETLKAKQQLTKKARNRT